MMKRLERMTWPQAEEYFKENDIVIIPAGSIESHGRHMPLGTDLLIPNKILELIEERTDVMCAPSMPYGCTEFLAPFPGTINLGTKAYYEVMHSIMESLRAHGAKRFIVLNGHGGNNPALDLVGLDLYKEGCLMAEVNWWILVWNLCGDWNGNSPWRGGHGAGEETAAIMSVDESLVDMSQIAAPSKLKDLSDEIKGAGFRSVSFKGCEIPLSRFTTDVTDNGWVGPDDPTLATKEWGDTMLNAFADWFVEFIEAFKKAELPEAK